MIVSADMTLQAEPTGKADGRADDGTAHRLVEAARSLMWEAGGPTFTVNQVVMAAGSSLKSFYRCFESKDDLLVALFADDSRRGAELLAKRVGRRPDHERLHTAVTGLFRFVTVEQQVPYVAALVSEHLRLAQTRPEELMAVRSPFVSLFEAEMRGAMERGEIRTADAGGDARMVFHLVLSLLHALVWHQIDDGPDVVASKVWAFCSAALCSDKSAPR